MYVTGGTRYAYLHVMYIPIIIASFSYYTVGGVVTGTLAGILIGPFMPLSVETGMPQGVLSWVYRTLIFVLVGFAAGTLAGSRKRQSEMLREQQVDLSDRDARLAVAAEAAHVSMSLIVTE